MLLLSFEKKVNPVPTILLTDEDRVKFYIQNIYRMTNDLWEITKRHPLDDSSLYSQARQISIQTMSIRANHLYRERKHIDAH